MGFEIDSAVRVSAALAEGLDVGAGGVVALTSIPGVPCQKKL